MALYSITEVLHDVPEKTVVMVSFNGGAPERYEIESLDPATCHAVLTAANDAVAASQTVPTPSPIEVADGQIVLHEA